MRATAERGRGPGAGRQPSCLSPPRHWHKLSWVLLGENQSTYIPLGYIHRLSNPGKIPLNIIEVQSGPYLEEDDIERIEDDHGRK